MKRCLVAAEWGRFNRYVLREGVPSIVRREMRAAFFAGAAATLGIVATFKDLPTAKTTLADLERELSDFVGSKVKENRACIKILSKEIEEVEQQTSLTGGLSE
jgi:hypothetical protein